MKAEVTAVTPKRGKMSDRAPDPVPAGSRRLPLEGVRVVELTHMVAGPASARLLAEQGADVIKVQPPIGDWVFPVWMDGS